MPLPLTAAMVMSAAVKSSTDEAKVTVTLKLPFWVPCGAVMFAVTGIFLPSCLGVGAVSNRTYFLGAVSNRTYFLGAVSNRTYFLGAVSNRTYFLGALSPLSWG